jgi:hypothetical protein
LPHGKVVKQDGFAKPPRRGHVRDVNLAKREQPGDRADIGSNDQRFEKLLEGVSFKVQAGRLGAIRAKIRSDPESLVSSAAAVCLLIIAGCLCSMVLHVIGAPEWAQIGGMALSWVMAFSLAMPKVLEQVRSAIRHAEHGPRQSPVVPDDIPLSRWSEA